MRPELIQAAELLRRNTPQDVEQAIGLLQNTVYSFSMKMCGHREDAEDTTQDVLFKSLRHLSRFPDPNALAAWLYTVTRNRCRRIRRTHSSAPARELSLDELMPGEVEMQLLLSGEDSPERNVLHAEQHHLLHQAVLHIPSSLRLVLVLHDMEELSTEQVAQILELQPGTVRVRLHRARLSVRQEMNRILSKSGAGRIDTAPPGKAFRKHKAGPECRELFANLSEYLDQRMNSTTCEQMKQHIEACPNCIAFLKDLRVAIDRCKSLNMECDAKVAARMRELFTQEYLRLVRMPEQQPA
ncbi:MAG: sigma-70 family RNA polymerase sigma factor [Acidobacteriota bacterium]